MGPIRARRRVIAVLLVSALTTAVGTIDAVAAKPSRKKAIWGPVEVNGRSQFPIYRDLGVGIYQYALSWESIATRRPSDPRDPADPAYHWPREADLAAKESARYGIELLLMLIRTPTWASTGSAALPLHQRGTLPPDRPGDYADFAEAAARRYPGVRLWMAWGEPIRRANFHVHFRTVEEQRRVAPFGPPQREDARDYAELLDAMYGRLKQLSRRNKIIGGNTTTSGDLDPFNWIRYLRLRDGRPPRMDMYGHNPFGTRAPDLSKDQLEKGTADFCDLDLLARWLDRYLARAGRNRRLPIFISEYNAPTDRPGYEFNYYVTRAVQARWLGAALRIARGWKRIYTLGWYSLRDLERDDGRKSRTGLIDLRGVRKPAYFTFKRG
jgi:hypothetical protein